MKIIAETQRLLMREFQVEDAEFLFHLNSNPEVIRYTGNSTFKDVQEAEQFIRNYDHYEKYGHGRWAVLSKDEHRFLGWCGLKYHDDTHEHDIGYRFFQENWGKGYATESAQASLELGFQRFGMPKIIGRAVKENLASIRVLQKIGMHYDKDFDFEGRPGVIYKLEKH